MLKDEVPSPKGDWDTAWQTFNVKNAAFTPKSVMRTKIFLRLQKAMIKYIMSKDVVPTL